MQKVSVRDFIRYCEDTPPQSIVFDSDEQNACAADINLRIKSQFDKLCVFNNPNRITLSSDSGTMKFSRVKYLKKCKPCISGDVYMIVCGREQTDADDKLYKIILK